jgi:hypothetical protein
MEDLGICYGHWYILRPFDIICVHLVYFMVIWYIFSRFGTRKNLATLIGIYIKANVATTPEKVNKAKWFLSRKNVFFSLFY